MEFSAFVKNHFKYRINDTLLKLTDSSFENIGEKTNSEEIETANGLICLLDPAWLQNIVNKIYKIIFSLAISISIEDREPIPLNKSEEYFLLHFAALTGM